MRGRVDHSGGAVRFCSQFFGSASTGLSLVCIAAVLAVTAGPGSRAMAAGAVKLTDGTQFGGTWGKFIRISPDSSRVVFSADKPAGDTAAIFAVPTTGGPVTQLSGGTLVPDNHTLYPTGLFRWDLFKITPDGQSVIIGSEPGAESIDLIRAPIAGGPTTVLGSLDGSNVGSLHFDIASDSAQVVYYLRFSEKGDTADNRVVYSVPTTGGQAPVAMFDVARQTIAVTGHNLPAISPDGRQVICNDNNNLYIRDIDGGPVTMLGTVDPDLEIISGYFTRDGSHIIYTAQTQALASSVSSRSETYSVSADGSNTILLGSSSTSPGTPPTPYVPPKGALPTPYFDELDGSHLLRSSNPSAGVTEFSSLSLDTGDLTAIGTVTCPADRRFHDPLALHDASGAVYRSTDDNEIGSLWYAPFSDGQAHMLADNVSGAEYPIPTSFPWLFRMALTPNDQTLVYGALADPGYELYSVPLAGGDPVRLDAGPGDADYILSFALTPDGQFVIYTVGAEPTHMLGDPSTVTGLYAVGVHGGTPWLLNDPLGEGECIDGYQIAPDGTVVYWAGSDEDGYDLYAAAVPEPATLALIAAGGLTLLRRRRRTSGQRP